MQITKTNFFWLNLVWFQAFWFIAITYTQQAIFVMLLSIMVHFLLSPTKRNDLVSVILITFIGGVADSILTYLGIFNFPEGKTIPLWLVLLWVHFAIALNHSMQWLTKLPIYLQVSFGAIFGTFSYYMGSQLGAVTLNSNLILSLFSICITWAILLPLYLKISTYQGWQVNEIQ
jgi:hypothetical protein